MIMFTPVMLFYIIFCYGPMPGIIMAFQNYRFADGIFGSEWVGWANFKAIFSTPTMLHIIWNTLRIGTVGFVLGFPFPIIMALFLNEVRHLKFKKVVQTMVYLPHFLSWVAVAGIIFTLFAQEGGFINNIVRLFGGEPYPFLYKEGTWLAIFFGSGIWKGMGWGAIIYLAALSGVDMNLYEAAELDGAGRWKQMWYISIPSIIPTIVVNLILSAGGIVSVGFDQVYNLATPAVNGVSDVISTWTYRIGMQQMQFSISTAMGLFNSLLSMVLVLGTNAVAKRFDQNLW